MGKYLKQGFVRELEYQLNKEEISYSYMVQLIEEECIKNYEASRIDIKKDERWKDLDPEIKKRIDKGADLFAKNAGPILKKLSKE
jgi:hypothetical protein